MPFTPYHIGPALLFGLPLRRYIHVPTFLVASIIIDVEPFLVLVLGLVYPLHGYLHTIFLSFFVGLALGIVMYSVDNHMRPLYRTLLLESNTLNLRSFMVAGVLGTILHVMTDSLLYDDIRPFYPFTVNPFFVPSLSPQVYDISLLMIIIGIVYYLFLVAKQAYRKISAS